MNPFYNFCIVRSLKTAVPTQPVCFSFLFLRFCDHFSRYRCSVGPILSHYCRSAADPEPGRPAAGSLRPEGRCGDGGQLRHLCCPQVRPRDRELHLLRSGQPIRIQKVSLASSERKLCFHQRCSLKPSLLPNLPFSLQQLVKHRVNLFSSSTSPGFFHFI